MMISLCQIKKILSNHAFVDYPIEIEIKSATLWRKWDIQNKQKNREGKGNNKAQPTYQILPTEQTIFKKKKQKSIMYLRI